MLDWTWYFLHLSWMGEKVHFIILLPHFIRYTASPCFDLVEFVFLLVVTCLTNVNFFVGWEATRSALVIASEEHHEASINYFIDLVVSVLTSLDNFVLKEVLFVSMNCLLRSIIPASVDPFVAISVLPSAVYLSNYRLCNVVGVL